MQWPIFCINTIFELENHWALKFDKSEKNIACVTKQRDFSNEEVQSNYKTLLCKISTWLLPNEDGSTHLFVHVCNNSVPYHFVEDGAIFFPW